jgi:hypothetical protein
MISISVEGENAVKEALRGSPKKVNLVLSRAVNRTVTNVKSNISKQVRAEYVIKASDVKNSLHITKATTSKPYAIVRSAGKKIDLTKFRISPKEPNPKNPPRGGYKVQVKKSEGLKVVDRGFLAYAKGSLGLFQRIGSSREPIKRLMGPSIPEMINRPKIINYIEEQAGTMLEKRLGHEMERVLGAKAK